MTTEHFIWEFLPSGLKCLFTIVKVERLSGSFHVWLDEIRQKSGPDSHNYSIIGKGYSDYCTIQDHLPRGVPMFPHLRKCKWLDKDTGEIFSYDIDYRQEEGTLLSSDLVSFLKGED